jgi:hypothetical protein
MLRNHIIPSSSKSRDKEQFGITLVNDSDGGHGGRGGRGHRGGRGGRTCRGGRGHGVRDNDASSGEDVTNATQEQPNNSRDVSSYSSPLP